MEEWLLLLIALKAAVSDVLHRLSEDARVVLLMLKKPA